jgi:hypothetical protein
MPQATNPIETLHAAMAHAAYVAFSDYVYQDRDWAKHDAWRATLKREEMKTAVAPADCFVEKTRKHTDYDMTVAAMFVQTWGSTALGFGGIGGQAFTSAYVSVIESNLTGEHAVYFHGRLAYVIDRPNEKFWEDVHRHRMVDAKDGKATYERTN